MEPDDLLTPPTPPQSTARSLEGYQRGDEIPARPGFLRAALTPGTYDPETRQVDVVLSTGAPVLRRPFFDDDFVEELEMNADAIRLERFNAGAPLVDTHMTWSVRSTQVGGFVPGSARVENGRLLARAQLSRREDCEGLRQDVADGIVHHLSVAYFVHQVRDITEAGDDVRRLLVVDWEPYEGSLVSVPADFESTTRSADGTGVATRALPSDTPTCTMLVQRTEPAPVTSDRNEPTMEPDELTGEAGERNEPTAGTGGPQGTPAAAPAAPAERTAPQPTPTADTTDAERRATEAERARVASITAELTRQGITDENLTRELLTGDFSVEQANTRMLDHLAEQRSSEPATNGSHGSATVGAEQIDKARAGVENALMVRYGGHQTQRGVRTITVEENPAELTEYGRDMQHLGPVRMMETLLEARGISCARRSRGEIVDLALGRSVGAQHGTSDFANITANVANNLLLAAYEEAPRTFLPISRQRNAPDFKQIRRTKMGGVTDLEQVPEHGEVPYGTFAEEAENYQVESYGKIVSLSRKALVNDDLGAFDQLPGAFGAAATRKESDIVWALITGNVTLGDGVALFAGGHNNTLTGAISITSLSTAREQLRLQRAPARANETGALMNLSPAYLIVPAALATLAEQHLMQKVVLATAAANANVFEGKMQLIVEGRLDAHDPTYWYMAANPAMQEIVEWAYLEGMAGPKITMRDGFEVEGLEMKAVHDFGAAMLDHRGIQRSTG